MDKLTTLTTLKTIREERTALLRKISENSAKQRALIIDLIAIMPRAAIAREIGVSRERIRQIENQRSPKIK